MVMTPRTRKRVINTEEKNTYNIYTANRRDLAPQREVACSERRCKGRGIQIESPLNFSDPAKNLLIVANIANFRRRNVRTHRHFAIMVVRKFLKHHVVPSADKFPFEVAERERDPVTFHALNPAYYKQDFNGLFHYDICNVVVFIFVSIHCAICFARQWLSRV